MKKTTILIFIISLSISATSMAQDRFGLTFGSGVSTIDNYKHFYIRKIENPNYYKIIDLNYENTIAWNFGAYYIKTFHSKSYEIGGELLIKGMGAYMKFYTIPNIEYIDPYRERLIYLSVPIFIQFDINNNCYFKTGITNSILLKRPEISDRLSDKQVYELGGNLTFGVVLSDKIKMEIEWYQGLTHSHYSARNEEVWLEDTRLYNSSFSISFFYQLSKLQ